MNHYLLVGSGIAGLSAAEAIRARDRGSSLTLVSAEPHPFYSRPGLVQFVAGTTPARRLELRTYEQVQALGLDRRVGEVVQVRPDEHRAVLSDGAPLRYDRLLLATGALSLRPDFPGAELDGVATLDNLADARHLVARLKRAKAAVVVGGGPLAAELAQALRTRGLEVHYLLRAKRYWGTVLDPVESRLVEDALERQGIVLHRETRVVRALGERCHLVGVETSGGQTLRCDVLLAVIGVRPRLELPRRAGLAVHRGVLVDALHRTSAADVFAAGDVAEHQDPDTGHGWLDALWTSAQEDGRAAGEAMAGDPPSGRPRPSYGELELGGLATTIVGQVSGGESADGDLLTISREDSEAWRARPRARSLARQGPGTRVRVLAAKDRLLGAVVMGDPRAARALLHLVRERADLTHLPLPEDPALAIDRLVQHGDALLDLADGPTNRC